MWQRSVFLTAVCVLGTACSLPAQDFTAPNADSGERKLSMPRVPVYLQSGSFRLQGYLVELTPTSLSYVNMRNRQVQVAASKIRRMQSTNGRISYNAKFESFKDFYQRMQETMNNPAAAEFGSGPGEEMHGSFGMEEKFGPSNSNQPTESNPNYVAHMQGMRSQEPDSHMQPADDFPDPSNPDFNKQQLRMAARNHPNNPTRIAAPQRNTAPRQRVRPAPARSTTTGTQPTSGPAVKTPSAADYSSSESDDSGKMFIAIICLVLAGFKIAWRMGWIG